MALVDLPDLRLPRGDVALFRTQRPADAARAMKSLARAFGVKGRTRDAGTRLVVGDKVSELELFPASGSMRWSTLSRADQEAKRTVRLLDDAAARGAAEKFLVKRELGSEAAAFASITATELAVADRRGGVREPRPIAQHVNFRFAMGGLPVFGPGAKIQVTLGHAGAVLECYRFWRETDRAESRALLSADELAARLAADPAFAELREQDGARVAYRDAQLGYFALPPREAQGWLLPVLRLRGTVTTRKLPRYDFTRYALAVAVAVDEVKRLRAAAHPPALLFS